MIYANTKTQTMPKVNKHKTRNLKLDHYALIDWSLTALSTQFRSYRAFQVELYYKY